MHRVLAFYAVLNVSVEPTLFSSCVGDFGRRFMGLASVFDSSIRSDDY